MDQLQAMLPRIQKQDALANKLLKENPALGITAFIMAGDMMSAEQATEWTKTGVMPAIEAVNFIGSYARFQWAVDNLPEEVLFSRLPELWRGSDPDDTKPEYLRLWTKAWRQNGCKPIYDTKPLAEKASYKVYRGQAKDAPVGISWSLDRKVAVKFANSGGLRKTITNGILLQETVYYSDILAYITGRGESEVIIPTREVVESLK